MAKEKISLYDDIAQNYYMMDKIALKNYILEALWQLSQRVSEEEYQEACAQIIEVIEESE